MTALTPPLARAPLSRPAIERWHKRAILFVGGIGLLLAVLAAGPLFLPAGALERLVALYVYVLLGVSWNLLAGFGGLVSVGQQAFFGLGAYGAIRLSVAGLPVYAALALADRGYVMEKGRILREGDARQLLESPELATHLALGPRSRPAENA